MPTLPWYASNCLLFERIAAIQKEAKPSFQTSFTMPPLNYLRMPSFAGCWPGPTLEMPTRTLRHRAGLAFLNALVGIHGKSPIENATVNVYRQIEGADIVAEIGGTLVLLIEDKVNAGIHGDQLTRYLANTAAHYPGRKILPLFLKTGDQSNYRQVEQAGYRLFLRSDVLRVLKRSGDNVRNAIFLDFLANVERQHSEVESYAVKPVRHGSRNGTHGWGSIRACNLNSMRNWSGTMCQMLRVGSWGRGGIRGSGLTPSRSAPMKFTFKLSKVRSASRSRSGMTRLTVRRFGADGMNGSCSQPRDRGWYRAPSQDG